MARTKNEKKKDQPKGTNTVLVIQDVTQKSSTEIKGEQK
jgi:hypothetical protein